MVFKDMCVPVLWTKVALALEWLTIQCLDIFNDTACLLGRDLIFHITLLQMFSEFLLNFKVQKYNRSRRGHPFMPVASKSTLNFWGVIYF